MVPRPAAGELKSGNLVALDVVPPNLLGDLASGKRALNRGHKASKSRRQDHNTLQ